MARVVVPSPLAEYTHGEREVSATGDTVTGLLADLERQFPGMRFRMIDEQGRIRPHMKFFINGELTRRLDANIRNDDTFLIVAALSGG